MWAINNTFHPGRGGPYEISHNAVSKALDMYIGHKLICFELMEKQQTLVNKYVSLSTLIIFNILSTIPSPTDVTYEMCVLK